MDERPLGQPATEAPKIGDRLRAARERRGLRIDEVSAALRIRAAILEAFEREDHNTLPHRVYALGQLRTYAAYLGLDPSTVAASWPVATGASPAVATEARPLRGGWATRLAGLRPNVIRSTRGLLAIGGLGIAVLAIGSFLALQMFRFILPPSISITSPSDAVQTLTAGTVTYELRGTADANASIVIYSSAGAQLTTRADASGLWRIVIPLGTGRTEVVAHAVKTGTGGESSTTAQRVFVVGLPDRVVTEITILAPTTNFSVQNGDIPISLVTSPNAEVAVTATDSIGELISATLTSDATGAVTGVLPLPAGRWTLSFSVTAQDGSLRQATRTVEVFYSGVTVSVAGGPAATWVRVWIDGVIDPTVGASGRTIGPGDRLLLNGERRIDIRSADLAGLLITLNGRTISGIGSGGGAETYAFLSTGKVEKSSRR